MRAGHVGFGPGLVHENQPCRWNFILPRLPEPAATSHVGAILLGRTQALWMARPSALDAGYV
jgi:hypothetical protein